VRTGDHPAAKTTKFYNTKIVSGQLADTISKVLAEYRDRVRQEVGETPDPRLSAGTNAVLEHFVEDIDKDITWEDIDEGFIWNDDYRAYRPLETDKTPLIPADAIHLSRWQLDLPQDLSRQAIIDALRGEFGRDIKLDDLIVSKTWSDKNVPYRRLTIALDKILSAPDLKQGHAASVTDRREADSGKEAGR
jgi:hypothetical protein